MADIRINALATTAASTASDDFVAVDGSANGTRKLNAYSPTFGGNLTVSGTGTSSVAGSLGVGTTSPGTLLDAVGTSSTGLVRVTDYSNGDAGQFIARGSRGTPSAPTAQNASDSTGLLRMYGYDGSSFIENARIYAQTAGTIATNRVGGVLSFWTHPDSTSAIAEAMRITQAQNLLIGTTTDRSNRVHIAAAGPSYIGMGQLTSTYAGIVFGDVTLADSASGFNIAGNAANSNLVFNVNTGGSMNWRVGNANAFTLSSGSNVLIGKTIDSTNGKLQLATHTTSAGGIGFGTDVSVYRDTNSTLNGTAPGGYALTRTGMNGVGLATVLNTASDAKTASDAVGISLSLQNSSSAAKTYGQIYAEINSATAASENGSLVFRTIGSGTVKSALTLDSSQNATFAGFVGIKDGMTAPSATSGTAKIYVDTADGDLKVIFGDGTIKTIATDT